MKTTHIASGELSWMRKSLPAKIFLGFPRDGKLSIEFYRMTKERKVPFSLTMPVSLHSAAVDHQARIALISGILPSLSAVLVLLMERGMASCKSETISDDPEGVVDLTEYLDVGEVGSLHDFVFDESEFD